MRKILGLTTAALAATLVAAPASSMAATTASDTEALSVTAPVTASITMTKVADSLGTAVTAFSFAETAPGATSTATAPYHVELTSTSAKWEVSAAVTTAFTSGGGVTLPNTALLVSGPSQGAGVYADLSASRVLQTGIAKATLTSGDFTFQFAPPATQDSGSYSGVITITAATL